MSRHVFIAAVALGLATAAAAEPVLRTEPAYQAKPKYLLLAFGPKDAHHVWLALDGRTLYVDRNGDGDLTGPNEKVAAKAEPNADPDEGFTFEVGELRVGGKVHKGVLVGVAPLKRFSTNGEIAALPAFRDAFRKDPAAACAMVKLEVESARFKGAGVGGRISQMAGFLDLDGVLQFGDTPAAAPRVHFDGPLQVTFYGSRPLLRVGRSDDAVLVVGTPGRGPGTFAMLGYEDTIPEDARPKLEVTFPPAAAGQPPVKRLYELKERC